MDLQNIVGENMSKKSKRIDKKLVELGRSVGLTGIEAIKAKRNVKNILTVALFAGFIILLGGVLVPGGLSGYFYGGASVKEFRVLLGGWL